MFYVFVSHPADLPRVSFFSVSVSILQRAEAFGIAHPSPRASSRSNQISVRRVPIDWPREAEEKRDQNEKLSERSEFFSFRFFLSIAGIGQSSGSPFLWLLAFGEAKESDSPTGETGGSQTSHFMQSAPSPPAFAGAGSNPRARGERGQARPPGAQPGRPERTATPSPCYTNSPALIHFVATYFSPRVTGMPPCSVLVSGCGRS